MNAEELTQKFIDGQQKRKSVSVNQIPSIDLYMDQVTTFMDTCFSDTRRYSTDKVLTKTMINNYAKNHLITPPVNKKYSKEQIIQMIYIYYLKNILSISDIQTMLKPVNEICADPSSDLDMASIYTVVSSGYDSPDPALIRDLSEKLEKINTSFSKEEPSRRETLQKFMYLCLLAQDVYLKKRLMESIIDDLTAAEEQNAPKKGKKKKEEK